MSELLACSPVRFFTMIRRGQVSPDNSMTKLHKPTRKPIYNREKKNKLFAGLGSVRLTKNCDLGLENAALGLRHRAAFSRPRSQFFTIRNSQPANNIYICSTLSTSVSSFFLEYYFYKLCFELPQNVTWTDE